MEHIYWLYLEDEEPVMEYGSREPRDDIHFIKWENIRVGTRNINPTVFIEERLHNERHQVHLYPLLAQMGADLIVRAILDH